MSDIAIGQGRINELQNLQRAAATYGRKAEAASSSGRPETAVASEAPKATADKVDVAANEAAAKIAQSTPREALDANEEAIAASSAVKLSAELSSELGRAPGGIATGSEKTIISLFG